MNKKGLLTNITSWDYQGPCPTSALPIERARSLHYFTDNATICLILAGGDIITVREHPEYGQSKVEIVGSVDEGILAAAWSPDEELLAVVTSQGSLGLMTRAFESLS